MSPVTTARPTADEIVDRLVAGNRRFVEGRSEHTDARDQRVATEHRQDPWAAVLGCADSRVPPETVFDTGLGELFTVRIAGNAVGPGVLGSLEYAVGHLGVPAVVVLGHTGCGALGAACAAADGPDPVPTGNLGLAVARVAPSCTPETRRLRSVRARVEAAVVENVRRQLRLLAGDPGPVGETARRGDVALVGAVYDLATGEAQLLTQTSDPCPSPRKEQQ